MIPLSRRTFLRNMAGSAGATLGLAAAGAGGQEEPAEDDLDRRNLRPETMQYQRLGRTNFLCSRLIFGCGAALAGGRAVRLLDLAYERGINYYDVGSNDYYKNAENHLAPFLKAHRGSVWVTSKGYARTGEELAPGAEPTVDQARRAAVFWAGLVDQSLKDLDTDYIDAYFTQGANNTTLVRSEELGRVFEQVKAAGKVGHIGVSTHQNAAAVLEAAVDTGWYDIAMVAVTPAGWYDWKNRALLAESPPLSLLRPQLDKARAAGLGLIGMKVARHIAAPTVGGKAEPAIYEKYYETALQTSALNPYQRAYTFVLGNGLDAVNADMQNLRHFEENVAAAQAAATYFA